MAKHKSLCLITSILLIIGGLNLGLTGLGNLIGQKLDILNMILGSVPTVLSVLYLLIGVAAVAFLVILVTCKDCGCSSVKCEDEKCEDGKCEA